TYELSLGAPPRGARASARRVLRSHRSAAERGSLDGNVECAVTAQDRRPAAWHPGGLRAERGGELTLEAEAGILRDDRGDNVGRQLPGPQPDDVESRAGREQVRDRAPGPRHARAVVQGDSGPHRVRGGGGERGVRRDVACALLRVAG